MPFDLVSAKPVTEGGFDLKTAKPYNPQAELDRAAMEKLADPTAGTGVLDKVAEGAGKFVTDMGRGARQIAASVGVGDAASADQDVAESRKRDAPLMKTTAGKVGYFAPALAAALIPGANTIGGAAAIGGGLGALQPVGEGESRVANALVGTVAGTAGQAVGAEAGAAATTALARRAAERAAAQTANAGRDATLAAGREAGYVTPPVQANPTVVNKVLEGTAGKISTAQAASAKNQGVTNQLIAKEVGLPADQPITREALKAARDKAGQAYETIASGNFVTDATYKNRIASLAQAQETLAKTIPELAHKDVIALSKSLQRNEFDGRTLIETVKALREKAGVAFKNGETEAARFFKGAATEVENLVERNLLYGGGNVPKGSLKAFREARQAIAKNYAAEGALEGSNINAAKYAQYLKKGKPLTGESKQVAEFASEFPKAMQLPQRIGSQPGISPLDVGYAALRGDAGGLAWLTGRPAVRAAILSKSLQDLMAVPNYSTPIAERVAGEAVKGGRLAAAMRAALPSAAVTSNAY